MFVFYFAGESIFSGLLSCMDTTKNISYGMTTMFPKRGRTSLIAFLNPLLFSITTKAVTIAKGIPKILHSLKYKGKVNDKERKKTYISDVEEPRKNKIGRDSFHN